MSGKQGLDAELEKNRLAKYDKGKEAEAIEWIKVVTGFPMSNGFFEDLQNGVVLCTIINKIKPGTIKKIIQNPKHYLESRENVNQFIVGCNAIGVESQDMITPLDLGQSSKDIFQILQCVFAVARQAQALKSGLPVLGPTYYKSVEDQQRIKERKEAREKEEMIYKQIENERAVQRRDLLLSEKENRRSVKVQRAKDKMEERQNRDNLNHLRKHETIVDIDDLEQLESNSLLYGIDLEHKLQQENKFDEESERIVLNWIESITQEQVDHIWLHLKSGRLLCKLANIIRPDSVRKINKQKIAMMERENIQMFLNAAASFNVKQSELFTVDDLYKAQDLHKVVNFFFALEKATSNMKHIPEMYRPFNYSTNKNHNSSTQPMKARNENEKLLPDEVPEEDGNCCSSCTIF